MKFSYINSFKILENFDLEIEFDDIYTHIYRGISDISINRENDDVYNYTIIDYFTCQIFAEKQKILKNFFIFKYSKESLDDIIAGKINFLQIEGDLTIYALYKTLEIIKK